MTLQDYTKFANDNPVCYLATVEDGQPRVRPLGMVVADESGFYFQTHAAKALVKQLKANNRVEGCFYAPDTYRILRIAGRVDFIEDLEEKRRLCQDRLRQCDARI